VKHATKRIVAKAFLAMAFFFILFSLLVKGLYLYFYCSRPKTLASTSTLGVADSPTASARWLLPRLAASLLGGARWGRRHDRLDWPDHCFLWGCGANAHSSKVKAIRYIVKDAVTVVKVVAKGVHVKSTHSLFSLN
jgi:hypothetical protein